MRLAAHRRTGFTLLELIVVLGIIALLAALSAGAVMRYRQTSMEKDTTIQMRKIQIGLDQQWKAARDIIQKEVVPDAVVEATTNTNGVPDMARARALHMKLRLRQEFPQSYVEARTGVLVKGPITGISYFYPPKSTYMHEIGQTGSYVSRPGYEGAALLMLILKQGRGGAAFEAGSIGNVKSETVEDRTQPIFVDAWGRPIVFRRAAEDDELDIIAELSSPPHAPATGFKDPQDPEGRLYQQNWLGRAEAVKYFATAPLTNPFDGTNRGPYILSAGRDGQFKTPDDICGFRIQQSQRGN